MPVRRLLAVLLLLALAPATSPAESGLITWAREKLGLGGGTGSDREMAALLRYQRPPAEVLSDADSFALDAWEQEGARRLRVVFCHVIKARKGGALPHEVLARLATAAGGTGETGQRLQASLIATWDGAIRLGILDGEGFCDGKPMIGTGGAAAGQPVVVGRVAARSFLRSAGQVEDLGNLRFGTRAGGLASGDEAAPPPAAPRPRGVALVPTPGPGKTSTGAAPGLAQKQEHVRTDRGGVLPTEPPKPTVERPVRASFQTLRLNQTARLGPNGRYSVTILDIGVSDCTFHVKDNERYRINTSTISGPGASSRQIGVREYAEAKASVSRSSSRKLTVRGFEKQVTPFFPLGVFLVDEIGLGDAVRIMITDEPDLIGQFGHLPNVHPVGGAGPW